MINHLKLEPESIQEVARQFGLTTKQGSFEENRKLLADRINELIQKDFQQLVSILYRLDVSEEKVKRLLREHPDQHAGDIIAALVIERQLQKIQSRRAFKQRDNSIDDDEKW